MSPSRQQVQHPKSVVRIARLAQNLAIHEHNCVGPQHISFRTLPQHSQRLFPRHALGKILRRFPSQRNFWNIGRLHGECNPCVTQKFLAARRSGGENQHDTAILPESLIAAHVSPHRFNQLRRIIANAIFENSFNILDVRNIL